MLTYVSGPYTALTKEGIDLNILAASEVAIKLWDQGHTVICPHTNSAHFGPFARLTDDQWILQYLKLLARSDALVILPNYEKSKGTLTEIAYAESRGIPVYYWPEHPPIHPTEARCPEQVQGFIDTIMHMYRIHLDKNADYSPANILAPGEIGLVTRLWDKVARLMNLIGFQFTITKPGSYDTPKDPKNESIEDSYSDLAVYGIIGLLLRRNIWGQ